MRLVENCYVEMRLVRTRGFWRARQLLKLDSTSQTLTVDYPVNATS